MNLFPLLLILLLGSATVCITLGMYALRHRETYGAYGFALFMLGESIWTVGYLFELIAPTYNGKIFWDNIQFVGTDCVIIGIISFALTYTQHTALARRLIRLLWLVPFLNVLLVWSDPFHHMVRIQPHLIASSGLLVLSYDYGEWMLFGIFYNYMLIFIALVFLIIYALRSSRYYQTQATMVILGITIPFVASFFSLTRLIPFPDIPDLDITPYSFALVNPVLAWALFRHRLFDLAPIARDLLMEQMSDGVLLLDIQQRIVDSNPTAQMLLENNAKSLMGSSLDTLLPAITPLLHHTPDHSSIQFALPPRSGDDAPLWLNGTVTQMYKHSSQPIGWLIVLHDVTERKRFEDELQQARAQAEAANQAKSVFLATMSHELRTPLNAILGFAQMMGRSPTFPSEHRDSLAVINRSGDHLLTLINNVLDLSKIEDGHVAVNEGECHLHHVLEDLEAMFRLRADEKGIALVVRRSPDLPHTVRTDELKLRQILINLLSNAVKFTHRGTVSLSVQPGCSHVRRLHEAHATPDTQRCRLHFEVCDTGPGIAPDEQELLFEAFTQAASGQQTNEGTGLGLTISRKFVQLLGGTMMVQSEEGHGSVFSFDIEVAVVPTGRVQSEPRSHRQIVGLAPGQTPRRILITDDRADNRSLLLKLLDMPGFELREACNGKEALDVWETWHPHLIWMDIRMPVLDGYETTRRIKSAPQGKETVIVALTASAFEEERATVLHAGCDDFVYKPFQEYMIFETMSKHLGVSYRYADDEYVWSKRPAALETLTLDALVVLPISHIKALYRAALLGDFERLSSLIREIPDEHASLAALLHHLVDTFRFDQIITVASTLVQERPE